MYGIWGLQVHEGAVFLPGTNILAHICYLKISQMRWHDYKFIDYNKLKMILFITASNQEDIYRYHSLNEFKINLKMIYIRD